MTKRLVSRPYSDGIYVKDAHAIFDQDKLDKLISTLDPDAADEKRGMIEAELMGIAGLYRASAVTHGKYDPGSVMLREGSQPDLMLADEATTLPARGEQRADLVQLKKHLKRIVKHASLIAVEGPESATTNTNPSAVMQRVVVWLDAVETMESDVRPLKLRLPRDRRALRGHVNAAAEAVERLDSETKLKVIAAPSLAGATTLSEAVEGLFTAVSAVEEELRQTHGPSANQDLLQPTGMLWELYRRVTGKRPTHTPRKGTAGLYGRGLPQSAFGKFVVAFYRAILGIEQPTETAISGAIAEVILRSKWVEIL